MRRYGRFWVQGGDWGVCVTLCVVACLASASVEPDIAAHFQILNTYRKSGGVVFASPPSQHPTARGPPCASASHRMPRTAR